jgi:hypothetical protein
MVRERSCSPEDERHGVRDTMLRSWDDDPTGDSRAMLNESRPCDMAGKPATDAGRARTDLDPDESNIFGPDAPNTRKDDTPGGRVAPEAPPPRPSTYPLDHGDFAPDET